MAIEKDLKSEFEEESYRAMDSVIMDTGINQLIEEREDSKLSDIVNALQSALFIKSMSLSESQKHPFFSRNFWKEALIAEQQNVKNCLVSKLSQKSVQSKNLAEFDVELCINFSVKTETIDIEKEIICELCDELITFSRKSRHLPLIKISLV